MPPEILWPILAFFVAAGLAAGLGMYVTRDKSKDALSERATRRIMDDPGPEPMEGDAPEPPRR